jgi:hypothetical protein
MGISSPALTEAVGHVNQVHGVYLFGNRLVSLVVWGSKVDIQILKHDMQAAFWACHPRLFNVR